MPQPPVQPLKALDLARRIERGEMSPADVVELCAAALAANEERIGAFASLDLAGARARAAAAPERLAATPLRGLPVGIKDIFDTADLPTSHGSPIHAENRPGADAALVSMVKRAGGLVLGKTVTTPFAFLDPAGTRNPHHPEHTPGGSSSGSAAAVAAGMVPIAIGTQTGGSVVRPGAFCGVAAYKPSFRVLPTVGVKTFSWSLDTPGLFAAGVADVAYAAAALTGRDLRVDGDAPAAPRIGLARTHVWPEASPAMQTAVERTARAAAAAGATLREVTLPPVLEEAFRAHAIVQDYEAYRALAYEYDHHREKLGPNLRQLLDDAATLHADDYDQACRIAERARHALATLMEEVDVLLTPSAPGAAPRGLATTGQSTFNRLWTLMGTPCINVPGLIDESGLPLGVQVVGRFGRDRAALEAALFVERVIASGRAASGA
ncbi:MAG: amidase [Rhodoplanes sp.]|uniref:amidase n=1 Tax=Rhodoplanes sp. TaxID=1968906 RepID=UPI0018426E8B|nr:amidase [Rhodoplanes sp.]NVO12549.1 amidase [Rhodoplanes sp.]